MSLDQKSYDGLRRRLNLFAVGTVASIIMVAGISSWQDHVNTIAWTERHIQSLAGNLAEHAARSLDAVNLTLLTVKKQAERDRKETPRTAQVIIKEFKDYIAELPQIRGMILTDANGIIRYTERKKSIGMDIHDRKYFKYLKDTPNAGLYIGKPLKGRTTDNWFFSTSRQIVKPDGSFDGITMALVKQEYFNDVYKRVEEEQGVSSAYVTDKGLIFATSPKFTVGLDPVYGQVIDFIGKDEEGDKESGSFQLMLFDENFERLVSYAKVPSFPIYIVTSIPVDKALVPWNARSTYLFMLVVVSLGVLLGLVSILKIHLQKRKEAETALFLSEQRYRDVVESSSDWVWECDADLKFTYFSERYKKVTGMDPEQFIGTVRGVYAKEGEGSESFKKHFSDMKAEKTFRDFIYEATFPNGRHFHFKASGRPIYDVDGTFIGYRGIGTDITEQTQIDLENKNLEKQLRHSQKMETIGRLTGGIAHDFNNILNPIVGFSEILGTKLPKDSKEHEWVGRISAASHRAINLIKQIMTMSRQGESTAEPTNLQQVVSEALGLLKSVIPKTIKIHEEILGTCRPILADPAQMHQTVMNLCTNASQAMEEKGGELSVVLEEFDVDDSFANHRVDLQPGTYVRLSISDTGYGMDEAIKEKIFEPFFTTKENGKGTGLGLATVHGIVRSHGGCINVYSELGHGSTFQVYLPVVEGEGIVAVAEEALFKGRGERVLVVDDEVENVDMLLTMFSAMGLDPTGVTSSLEALDKIKADPNFFDVVITDQTMPGMIGSQLVEFILDVRSDLPIVMVTGFSATIDSERAKEIGVAEYLTKPLTRMRMSKALQNILG
ncbi:MAG: ATP-binding protein [Alphaproteobacteria bacterium]|nr:ATP-binding protein [Alphaproteobacteria bacterium]